MDSISATNDEKTKNDDSVSGKKISSIETTFNSNYTLTGLLHCEDKEKRL